MLRWYIMQTRLNSLWKTTALSFSLTLQSCNNSAPILKNSPCLREWSGASYQDGEISLRNLKSIFMPANRLYTPLDLDVDTEISLDVSESGHLTRVLRVQRGECVELVNGKGELAHAAVTCIDPRSARLNVLSVKHEPPP